MSATKIIYRKSVTTARELADIIHEASVLFDRTDDKYLMVQGEYVCAVEIIETTLTDKSTVLDIRLILECSPET